MTRPIQKVFIGCYLKDAWLANICVASIRHWYPNVEIQLIKDQRLGRFDTSLVERTYNVSIADTPSLVGAFGRLEICFKSDPFRFLYLDADIVMGGPILDELSCVDSDFIVSSDKYSDPASDRFKTNYYDLERLKLVDRDFEFPGRAFNSGQFVGTSGLLNREDFSSSIDWTCPPKVKCGKTFKMNDQGALNYVLYSKHQNGSILLEDIDFKRNALDPRLSKALLKDIKSEKGIPYVIHWIGPKPNSISKFTRSDVLWHFQRKFLADSGVSATSEFVSRIKTRCWLHAIGMARRGYALLPEVLKKIFRKLRVR